ALGENHPGYASILNNLAGLFIATGRVTEAFTLKEQANTIDDYMIGQVFSIGSESQRMAFLEMVGRQREGFLSLVWRQLGASAEAVRAAFDLVLRRKAIGAEALAAQRDAVLGGKYPDLAPVLLEWSTLRRLIAQQTLAGPRQEGLQAHRRQLAQ